MQILDYNSYIQAYKALEIDWLQNVRAFYNYEIDAICTDPKALLIPLDDHLIHRGDGVFESFACINRKILQLDKHVERLQSSLDAIGIVLPLSLKELRNILIETAKAGNFSYGSLRLLIGRGRGGFGVDPKECKKASIYIIALENKQRSEDFWNNGMTACRSKIPVKQHYLAKIKSTNYLPNVLMAQEAHKEKVNITFAFDENNFLAESAIANVGIYKDNTFYFPKFDHILTGTAVMLAIEIAKEIANVEITNISEEMLVQAEEVFAFGSTLTCMGITQYNHKDIGNGKVGEKAKYIRAKLIEKYDINGVEY